MVRISFPDGTFLDVEPGTNLLAAILKTGRPIGNSCSAIGICAKCWIQVKSGMNNLSRPSSVETKLLEREKLPQDHRISCLTRVLGPITITTSYWA